MPGAVEREATETLIAIDSQPSRFDRPSEPGRVGITVAYQCMRGSRPTGTRVPAEHTVLRLQ